MNELKAKDLKVVQRLDQPLSSCPALSCSYCNLLQQNSLYSWLFGAIHSSQQGWLSNKPLCCALWDNFRGFFMKQMILFSQNTCTFFFSPQKFQFSTNNLHPSMIQGSWLLGWQFQIFSISSEAVEPKSAELPEIWKYYPCQPNCCA